MAWSSRAQTLSRVSLWVLPAMVLLASGTAHAAEGGVSLVDAAKILLTHGGPFPYINIGVSALSAAIVIERAIMLSRYSTNGEALMLSLVRLVREGQIDRARKVCLQVSGGFASFGKPTSVLARVMKSGLDASNRGEAEISAAMEETMLEISPLVAKRIPALFPLANIATLIGLIGTISGLIKCFSALGVASANEKATVLSRGISEAMYNTAFGLMIAVTCIATQLWLATKGKSIIEEVEFNAVKLENLLGRRIAGELDAG